MKYEHSVVLVSGGLDSAVCATIAAKSGRASFLHVNYGQRTEDRELDAFSSLADHFGITERLVADLRFFSEIGASALTDKSIKVPEGRVKKKGVPATYVPFRNANLLSIGVSWAEAIGANSVYIGAVEEDSSGYPDCTEGFLRAFQRAITLGTKAKGIKIKAPLLHKGKPDIVRLGVELGTPFEYTWSCYGKSKVACGRCDSCLLRLKGFKVAGVKDPIRYAPGAR